ncbi:MAG: HEPN domain-containing protein [Sphingobacterium sp.]|jgi:HEPN domain-containing protein|nr:HEPN domain-containing protein [Sphingobacterium sp.]
MITALESNIEIIFKHLMVDEIFLWNYNRNGIEQTIIQVHTHNKQRSRTTRERCQRALDQMEGYHFTFYNTRNVQSRIDDGLGRLHLNCQPHNRIYLNPEYINSVTLPGLNTEELIERTKEYIKREKDKITAFMDGYHLYYSKENYPNAAFMLHQALEISLRIAQKLLLGVEERSHSIKQNIDFFKPYDSVLSGLIVNKEEEQAINRLTDSYTLSRYHHNFTMDLQKIEFCRDIADRILVWINDYEQELVSEIEEKHISNVNKPITIMEKKTNINHDHRDLIHNALETYGQVHGLYCFAYTTRQEGLCNLLNVQQSHNEIHHYYLFAIMSNQNRPIVDLQNCVMQLLPEKIKITLIAESPEQVEKKLNKGDVFRTNLLQLAECWYRDREFLKEGVQMQDMNLIYRQECWTNRHSKVRGLNLALKECSYDMGLGTMAYLLALSLEQSCLSLLNDHLNYTPNSTNLNYLMDICEVFYPTISSVFGRHNERQQTIFSLLIEAQNKYRYSATFIIDPAKLEVLKDNIAQFSDDVSNFIRAHFQQQKELQEATKTENIEQCA